MDQKLHDVRQDINETRAAMTEKIEMLEGRVREAVEDTKSTVKRSVDPNHHVQEHPWAMVGLAVLAGCILRRATASRLRTAEGNGRRVIAADYFDKGTASAWPNQLTSGEPSKGITVPSGNSDALDGICEQYKDELSLIKGAAVGAVVGIVRDIVRHAVPAVSPYLKQAASKFSNGSAQTPEPTTRQTDRAAQQNPSPLP